MAMTFLKSELRALTDDVSSSLVSAPKELSFYRMFLLAKHMNIYLM
jgi:hypothetical protein